MNHHTVESERTGDGWTAMQVLVAAVASLVSIAAALFSASYSGIAPATDARIRTLETHAAGTQSRIVELERRVLLLTRPDAPAGRPPSSLTLPLQPPWHPGRLDEDERPTGGILRSGSPRPSAGRTSP